MNFMKRHISVIFAFVLFLSSACASGTGDAKSFSNPANEGEKMTSENYNVKITVKLASGEKVLNAKFYDNAATRKLISNMPISYDMQNLYGREMCYRMGNGALSSAEAKNTTYRIGDISYWPPRGSLVILYKQNGEVFEQQPIGHTDDDVSFFTDLGTTKVTFELDEN